MFIRIVTGGWQESITKNFGEEPAILQSAYVNAVLTLLLVVIGIAANVLLLKRRRIGVTLGFIAMSIQGPISVLRILSNVIYLLALLKTRKALLLG